MNRQLNTHGHEPTSWNSNPKETDGRLRLGSRLLSLVKLTHPQDLVLHQIFYSSPPMGKEIQSNAPGMPPTPTLGLNINWCIPVWPGAYQMEPPSPIQALGVNPFPSRFIIRTVPRGDFARQRWEEPITTTKWHCYCTWSNSRKFGVDRPNVKRDFSVFIPQRFSFFSF